MNLKTTPKQGLRALLSARFLIASTGGIGLIVLIMLFAGPFFRPEESSAIPSNAADFSELCYTIADGDANLYTFNKYTGGPSNVGNTSIGSPEATTLNLIGDSLFIIDGSADEFGYVNLGTGSYTVVSSDFLDQILDGADGRILIEDIDAMTVDNDDVFWVASRDNNDTDPSYLAKIKRNGSFVGSAFGAGVDYIKFIAPDGFPSVIDAMAYDPIEDVLYACANDGSGNPTYNNLMQIDPETGVGTFIGNFNIGDVEGMGFDGEGNMYATTGTSSNTSANRNSFFSVDKTTAIATRVFTFSSGTDFETCDCVIGYKNTIKGTVFFDADNNAYQNNGEGGYEGVTVSLYYDENNNGAYDSGTDGLVRSVETNAQGQYTLYDAWESGTLNYVITIDQSDLPTGASLSTDAIEVASFSSGSNTDLYNDFGYIISGSSNNTISGYVYGDDDQDQTFDGGESGIEGTTVYLYQDIDADGVYTSGTDELISSTATDATGAYSFERPYIGGVLQLELNTSSTGDAEESGGSASTTSSDLDFGEKMVGMIFSGAALPQGTTIESAYLQMVSSGNYTSTTSLTIYGEDVDDPNAYSGVTNDISGRTTTTASESWTMPYWSAANITYTSPDISSIIQEIVDRSGWTSDNDINIITSQDGGKRSAISYNSSSSDAPRLFIQYNDASLADRYLTFVDESTLPAGSSLTTDNIETASFTSGGNSDPNNNFGVYQDPTTYNTISGTVFYDSDANGSYNGSDVGENNITVCLFDDITGNGSYDADVDELLQVVKTDGSGDYSFQEAYSSTVQREFYISQGTDDADGSTVTTTSTDLDLGDYNNAIRFQNIGIPQGATITEAYLEFQAEENTTGSYSTVIEGVDQNDASTFSSGQNLSSLARTSASTTWSGSDAWSINDAKTTPSILSIVQEIVNRAAWNEGNSMAFILNQGSGHRAAHSFESNPARAPKLVVSYTSSQVNYVVIIKETNLPTGYTLTTDNLEIASFTSGGNSDVDNDFGYELDLTGLNTISGNVYRDRDQDATKDVGEVGQESITIQLYQDDDCDGTIDVDENLIGTTSSNADGDYSINDAFGYTVNQRVGQSSDDADESTVSITSSDLDFAQSAVALRFTSLDIPQGVTITSAYIEFTAEASKSGFYSFTVEGVDVDNASTYSNSQNLSSLTRTSASTTMTGNDAWTVDGTYNSPSLTAIVQEIVDRSGWGEGNSMGFIFNTGTGDRDAYSYDNSPSKAPRLVVEYTLSTKCYVVQIDNTTIVQGGTLTTSSTHAVSFNSDGNTDSGNDFGIYYAALPVELVSFGGKYSNGMVSLQWKTSAELNNDYFEVQWSKDALNYEAIGTVSGNGTTLVGADYSFDHYDAAATNYYRLKQVDFDGTTDYSKTITISINTEQNSELEVFPNPFSTELALSLYSGHSDNARIEIWNLQGSLVYETTASLIEGQQTIQIRDLDQLQSGRYIVRLTSGHLKKSATIQKH